jgi:hypothetical protein
MSCIVGIFEEVAERRYLLYISGWLLNTGKSGTTRGSSARSDSAVSVKENLPVVRRKIILDR